MSVTLSQVLMPSAEIGLSALSAVLDKAAAFASAKKIDESVLLNYRLAPDMFALTRQVQIACDMAKNGAARLAGMEPPKFEDNETSIEQLKTRIGKTIAFLKTVDASSINGSGEREITFPLGPTNKGHMKGADFSIISYYQIFISI
jgi:uncharacterized protein